jgi:hypothetical protein
METSKISILEVKLTLESIIKEVGDLNNIETYPYVNNEFTTDDGLHVVVNLDRIPYPEFTLLNIPTKRSETRNVEYSVEGEHSQYKKTTYGELIKILKTVSDIVVEQIRSNSNIKGLVFLAANKNPKNISSQTDPQKTKLYRAIILKQISSLGWTLRNIELESKEFNGFLLYKK